VKRDELCRALWDADVHVDHERGLNFCVNRIRRALGDSARAPRFLETLPRQGYRFLVGLDAPDAASVPKSGVRPSQVPLSARIGLALLALFLQASALPRQSAAGRPGLPSLDPAAQAEFVRGRRLLDKGPAGWRESIVHFAEAARRDSSFALARYGLADAYMRLGENGELGAHQAFPAARAAVREALAIEDRAEPLVILAALALNYDWDWAAAEQAYLRALRLDPDLGPARSGYARLLSAAGRHGDALALMRDLEARDPSSAEIVRDSGLACYRAREPGEAARLFARWAKLRPQEKEPHHWLALLYHIDGRLEDARREARQVLVLSGAQAASLATFEALPPALALERYLRGSLRFLERLSQSRIVGADDRARLEALLGQRETALASLEEAADLRSPTLPAALVEPAFDSLAAEARFRALRARVGSPATRPVEPAPRLITVALLR